MPKGKYTYKVDNKMKGFGETDFEKKLIKVNKRRNKKGGGPGELLDTLVHESLHAKHPKAKEKTIEGMTKRVTPRLSKKAKGKFYKKLK